MISTGQEKLNKKDVRNGILGFILFFILLNGVTFSAVFMFFKSSQFQQNEIRKEITNYKTIQSKNDLLQERIEGIYSKMSLLASDKVENEVFLRDNIIEEIRDCRNIMGNDSVKEFRHYASLIKNMSEIVNLKNELISISLDEQVAMRNLQECQGRLNIASSRFKNSSPRVKPRR